MSNTYSKVVRSHVSWRGERNITYKGVETLLEEKPRRENTKRTIFATCGIRLLQMILEPDIGRCASKDVGSPRRVDCETPHWLERRTKHYL